jgi:hypothetical protein
MYSNTSFLLLLSIIENRSSLDIRPRRQALSRRLAAAGFSPAQWQQTILILSHIT